VFPERSRTSYFARTLFVTSNAVLTGTMFVL